MVQILRVRTVIGMFSLLLVAATGCGVGTASQMVSEVYTGATETRLESVPGPPEVVSAPPVVVPEELPIDLGEYSQEATEIAYQIVEMFRSNNHVWGCRQDEARGAFIVSVALNGKMLTSTDIDRWLAQAERISKGVPVIAEIFSELEPTHLALL